MLEAQHLSFSRDDKPLFDNFSLTVKAGEVIQISGANGVGKSTLLRLLCGLLQPESGQITWMGNALTQQRELFHAQLLWLGHQPGVKSALTARENLSFYHSEAGVSAWYNALEAIGLVGYEDIPLRQLSAGQQRRVALSRLWLTRAKLWILDEPFTALDTWAVEKLTRRLEWHVLQGGSVVLTTHQPLRELKCPIRFIHLQSPSSALN